MRAIASLALLALAPWTVSGCATTKSGLAKNVPADVTFAGVKCSVKKVVVLDWNNGVDPDQVEWLRTTTAENVSFEPGPNEKDPTLFDPVWKKHKFGFGKKSKKSGPPTHTPKWTSDFDGNPDTYTYCYNAKRTDNGDVCDPEICIQKSGSGCNPLALSDRCGP